MLSWLMWLVLVGLLFRAIDMLVAALWPLPDWKQEARKWWWSPEGLEAQAAIARWREARTASPLAAHVPQPPVPQNGPPPAPPRPQHATRSPQTPRRADS